MKGRQESCQSSAVLDEGMEIGVVCEISGLLEREVDALVER